MKPDPAARLGPVRRIAVFRALVLGDMICATPALRALKARFPQARLTLIGLPWARAWAERQTCIDEFIVFPGHPDLPEGPVDEAAWPGFIDQVRRCRFDMVVQLHGSGRVTNGLVAQWGARHIVAFHEPDRPDPGGGLGRLWPMRGTEPERLLGLVEGLGCAPEPDGDAPLMVDFPIRPADRDEALALLTRHRLPVRERGASYVCMHPGAQLASRRWPAARFAAVADALTDAMGPRCRGIVLTGVASEAVLVAQVQAAMRHPAVNLAGQTSLWSLGALIEGAGLLVCNDTGVSHVAAALRTPSVVVSCGADVSRWRPHDTLRHRVLWADRPCRPCMHAACPYAHECATDVHPDAVVAAALSLLQAGRGGIARRMAGMHPD
jgi:ADP-heptose:LPS heptosyltransferase